MKRLLSVLLALVMALGLLATTAWADETHTDHCVCCGNYTGTGHTSHETVNWQPWPEEGATTPLPTTAGNYYLTDNVTVSSGWEITANITLCLNGKTLSKSSGNDFITVKKDASLTITDCSANATGKITGGYHIIAVAGGTFNLYGGEITGRSTAACGSVYVTVDAIDSSKAGTFNMYGGIITGNTTTRTGDLGGGGVYNEGTFNMYGGEISGNTGAKGAGVFNTDVFNMYGGTIKNNTASTNGNGAGVYNGTFNDLNKTGNFTFTGGTVSGEVYVKENTTATILGQLGTDATIKGADKYTVTFNTSGGSAVASQTLIGTDATAVEPADPTKEGYAFVGWVNDDGTEYDFDRIVTSDLTLTAVWEEIPAPEGHTHIRRQPAATTTTTDTTATDTTKTDTVTSAKTFDMGVMVYGVMAAASVLGMGYVGKKRG